MTRLALVNVHAQQLLVLTRADPGRLDALAELSRRRARAARRWQGGWALVLRRAGPLRWWWSAPRWAFAFHAATRASRDDIATQWTNAAELAEAGLTMVRLNNADLCLSARVRLVAQADRAVTEVDWTQFRRVAELGIGEGDQENARPGQHAAGVRGYAAWDVTTWHQDQRSN